MTDGDLVQVDERVTDYRDRMYQRAGATDDRGLEIILWERIHFFAQHFAHGFSKLDRIGVTHGIGRYFQRKELHAKPSWRSVGAHNDPRLIATLASAFLR